MVVAIRKLRARHEQRHGTQDEGLLQVKEMARVMPEVSAFHVLKLLAPSRDRGYMSGGDVLPNMEGGATYFWKFR